MGLTQGIEQIRSTFENRWKARPLPGAKDPNYRAIRLQGLTLDRAPKNLSSVSAIPSDLLRGIHVTVQAAHSEITTQNLPEGVTVMSLLDAARKKPELVLPHLGIPKSLDGDWCAELVAARWQSGVFIHVKKNVKVTEPLRVLSFLNPECGLFIHRSLVILESGAELEIVDLLEGSGYLNSVPPLTQGLMEFKVADQARLKVNLVQNWGPAVQNFLRVAQTTGKDASIECTQVFAGGSLGQARVESTCECSGSKIDIYGAARGDGEQKFDFWVTANHPAPHTSSSTQYWAVMADQASSVFNGLIDIAQAGLKTDAYQKNRNLLLSNQATIHTLPKLLIAADDVKCAHGASVSSVDENQLFYLESRGLSRDEAQSMIVDGFTEPVISRLPGEDLQERVRSALTPKAQVGGEQ